MDDSDEATADIDLILTFRGIDVPTAKIVGRDACILTLRKIVDGREQRSDKHHFAYQNDIIWKMQLNNAKRGEFRLTLVSNDLHCSRDITIDDAALTQGALRVEFNRNSCRRKLTPVFLKRLWWNLLELLNKRSNAPKRDQRVLAQYGRRFRHGPVGEWASAHENLMMYGSSFEFRADFTGTARTWDVLDNESGTTHDFTWKSVGDLSIEVQPVSSDSLPEDWGVVEYDFETSRDPHGVRQVMMYSKGNAPGFWWEPHPVVLVEKSSK